ncbi:hypothetical protein NQT65_19275 [Pseudoalteromonas agarivorans]|uniref:hypothetical protein n=1 Tax=Pseudoalteromonas agarivorans TaxID=176102 RepID=UPI0021179227|nr:hypothetical protein [Pseudoalteromonas agarivorans]MCQ8822337.1 hypothetical protein [Pseudoalteromonas agarivorans]
MLDVTFEHLETAHPELVLVAIGLMVVWAAVLFVFKFKNWLKKRIGEIQCNRGVHDFVPLIGFTNNCNYASGKCSRCGESGMAERSERVYHD